MERITSVQNPLVKELLLLHERKGRREAGCFLAEGVRLVREAMLSGAPIERLLADEGGMSALTSLMADRPKPHGLPEPIPVTAEILAKLSDTKTPQGVLAVVRLPETNGSDFGTMRRILALERVQDPGNVGAMIRTADACGFDMVLLSADSADPWQPKVLRATMGSVWHVNVCVTADLPELIGKAQAAGILTTAAHPRDAVPCWDASLAGDVLIVIGNEANGISEEMLARVDKAVMIPMEGSAESLNAASAASMLMYESLRQRRAGG